MQTTQTDADAKATREAVTGALSGFADERGLRDQAAALFNALGYRSERTADAGDVAAFLHGFGSQLTGRRRRMFDRRRERFEALAGIEIVFQVTDDEIGAQGGLFDAAGLDNGRMKSFLFLAAELTDERYSRTWLAETTRALNLLFEMPTVVLFRHGATLTLAVVHRRAHKRDENRDVLERVTLVKDVRFDAPHRAHVDILGDLALTGLITTSGVRDFDGLHAAWETVLDTEALNRRFYRELFEWFERAVDTCEFPDDGAGDGNSERHVIRMITRLLFIWFLKEKSLVPEELFVEDFARRALKRHGGDRGDYYRAVLQNLFFATLNTEIDKRAFSKKAHSTHRDFSKYRYRDLLTDPDDFIARLSAVPFVNGGLFDCLDDFDSATAGGRRIDAFTDNITKKGHGLELNVPARLLLDPKKGLFPLFSSYKFTVEENTPLDQEVALDPELLGRVFENLLAAYNPETQQTARESTGSYYTPRVVVDYMVDEALIQRLTDKVQPDDHDRDFWQERLRYLLDYADAFDDADELFGESERERVVRAVAGLKIIDPAVGSGAFPMGILHKLTLILRRLDPENQLWECLQREIAVRRATAAFGTSNQEERDAELKEVSDTFQRYGDSDFGRKLYLVQNSIFGVDIQPIACQIAKLRFFISLAIEQVRTTNAATNFGIKPLPNLETRFVAANTLLALHGTAGTLTSERTRGLRSELQENREWHFHANSREKKLEYRESDKSLRGELEAELRRIGMPASDADRIARWDPYNQNSRADWFDPEYMFGVSDGFDIAIGNPPYVQLQKDHGALAEMYKNAHYETFVRTGDVYQLFLERGCNLLCGGGLLSYITSNSWLRAEYGKSTRRYFSERHMPFRLLEVGKDVFDNTIVDTCILILREGRAVDGRAVDGRAGDWAPQCADTDRLPSKTFPPPEESWVPLRPSGDSPWTCLSSVEHSVLGKMEAAGKPLEEWNVAINYGIKTGCNEAFIIDSHRRDALIAEDARSTEIMKPILRGRDIRKWRAEWDGLWLIDMHNGYNDIVAVDVEDYPAVKSHLDGFYDRLKRRQDKGQTPYHLRSCAYHANFGREKLFWMDMSPEGRFAYCDREMYCNDKGFVLSLEPGESGKFLLKYLCAILNSSLITWAVRNVALTTGMGLPQWKKFSVERLFVPRGTAAQRRRFAGLVDGLVAAKRGGRTRHLDSGDLEAEIDDLVYGLYGLTTGEIGAVRREADECL